MSDITWTGWKWVVPEEDRVAVAVLLLVGGHLGRRLVLLPRVERRQRRADIL
ncbi:MULTISPECIES: hypothetical protein [Natrialbaceae]|uniref:hypothetical protein n=1 Tax=Natrialbaceae TaxID=1644061 RepID=UPI00207D36E2|nr:hypothetical protein [Natronococcus sp. CG52]